MNKALRRRLDETVDVAMIAERLGVEPRTVAHWRWQRIFPEPDYNVQAYLDDHPVGRTMRAWRWETVLRWAGEHGRIHNDDHAADYRAAFNAEPVKERTYLGPAEIAQVRDAVAVGERQTAVAERFGVSLSTVSRIVNRSRHASGEGGDAKIVGRRAPRVVVIDDVNA